MSKSIRFLYFLQKYFQFNEPYIRNAISNTNINVYILIANSNSYKYYVATLGDYWVLTKIHYLFVSHG